MFYDRGRGKEGDEWNKVKEKEKLRKII